MLMNDMLFTDGSEFRLGSIVPNLKFFIYCTNGGCNFDHVHGVELRSYETSYDVRKHANDICGYPLRTCFR